MNVHMSNEVAEGCRGLVAALTVTCALATLSIIGAWAISHADTRPDACSGLTAAECGAATQEGR